MNRPNCLGVDLPTSESSSGQERIDTSREKARRLVSDMPAVLAVLAVLELI